MSHDHAEQGQSMNFAEIAAKGQIVVVGSGGLLGCLHSDLSSEGAISAQSMRRLSRDPEHPISKLQYPPNHPALDSLVRVHPQGSQ